MSFHNFVCGFSRCTRVRWEMKMASSLKQRIMESVLQPKPYGAQGYLTRTHHRYLLFVYGVWACPGTHVWFPRFYNDIFTSSQAAQYYAFPAGKKSKMLPVNGAGIAGWSYKAHCTIDTWTANVTTTNDMQRNVAYNTTFPTALLQQRTE